MIRYSLICSNAHDFEGWFRSSEDFDSQAQRGLLACPHCGDGAITKALMAPRVVTGEQKAAMAALEPAETPAAPPVPLAAIPPQAQEALAKLKEIKAALLANSENVGKGFAEEARKVHFGEAPARPIHGEASADEAKALIEDGIDILPLPALPGEQN
ncbi:DUF1178 family protein [Oryzibacter oryziterrae]|uniref:DUF1178 family protein n=1 Tax=Oryzibacter oryziterrae TaxID=2766474 RepID=UPI001F25EAEA|nr:DUF1178 family protein [Oryzibacter oryziterrae]